MDYATQCYIINDHPKTLEFLTEHVHSDMSRIDDFESWYQIDAVEILMDEIIQCDEGNGRGFGYYGDLMIEEAMYDFHKRLIKGDVEDYRTDFVKAILKIEFIQDLFRVLIEEAIYQKSTWTSYDYDDFDEEAFEETRKLRAELKQLTESRSSLFPLI